MVVVAELLKYSANASDASITTDARATGRVVDWKTRSRNKTGLEWVEGCLLKRRPNKTNTFLCKVDERLSNFAEAFNKASVIVTEAQKLLYLIHGGRTWPWTYNIDFTLLNLHTITRNDMAKKLNML